MIASQSKVRADGTACVVQGDGVTPHPPNPTLPPHANATMARASAKVFIGGVAAVRAGDAATCGHAASGSSKVTFG